MFKSNTLKLPAGMLRWSAEEFSWWRYYLYFYFI